jgi:AraC-like DNA-binding protein
LHFHPEFELNYIRNANGAKRIVGDHISTISDFELVLAGPNLVHTWEQGNCRNREIEEITILFHHDLFQDGLTGRHLFKNFKILLQRSMRGIAFSPETIIKVLPRLKRLSSQKGFNAFIELINLLNELSESKKQIVLSGARANQSSFYSNEKIRLVYEFTVKHYREKLSLQNMASLVNMTTISFNRYIKKHTGLTYIDFLNDFRISQASKLLIESTGSVSEIAYSCGFFNQSNFIRIFKKKKGCLPSEYRNKYTISLYA